MKNGPFAEYLLFGGSFDPPHLGHLGIIRYVLERGLCKHLLVLPASLSPFKRDKPPVEAKHRITLFRILLEELPAFFRGRVSIETWEIDRPPPSYTIDSLQHFAKVLRRQGERPRKALGRQKDKAIEGSTEGVFFCANNGEYKKSIRVSLLGLLLGSDSAYGLSGWKSPEKIIENFPIIIFRRSLQAEEARARLHSFAESRGIALAHPVVVLENPLIECSSSRIKLQLKKESSPPPCLTAGQMEYIKINNLFS